MPWDHNSTHTTIGSLIIFFLVDQINSVDYAIKMSNWNSKMTKIGSFFNTTYCGMNFTKKKKKKNEERTIIVNGFNHFLNKPTKITKKHNNFGRPFI